MEIYRVRVVLQDIKPPIWREIELASQTTLKQFHRILQIAMGWEDYHLHEFVVKTRRYGIPDPEFDLGDSANEVTSERKVSLAEVLPKPGSSMLYLYDFGDSWHHEIKLEAVSRPEPDTFYPRVVKGARSCPPEDCGGTPGYEDLLEILLDPAHEEFDHMRAWVGPKFNAEVFSLDAVNQRLRKNRSLAVK
jgi:hypothetical protein